MRYSQKGCQAKQKKPKCGLCNHTVKNAEHESTRAHQAELARREKAQANYEAINKAQAEFRALKEAGKDTTFSLLLSKYCHCCDKRISNITWYKHIKTQRHITKLMNQQEAKEEAPASL